MQYNTRSYEGRPRYDLSYESEDLTSDTVKYLINNPIIRITAPCTKSTPKKSCDCNKMPRFGGAYSDGKGGITYITEVIYEKPVTIVLWNDGTKTTSKCDPRDEYSPETGLTLAVLKKVMGGEFVAKILEDWVSDGAKRVTLKDVRKKHNN